MDISLQVNGNNYRNFLSVEVFKSMESLTGTFTFVATIDRFNNFPIKLQDEVIVKIGEESILTGFVELLEPSYTNNSHVVKISGRDITCDVVDSSSLISPNYSPNITLKTVVERLLSGNNIDIEVIDLVNPPISIFKFGDIIEGEVGQNMWEIIDKYCKKRQVLANTNGDGNIILTRAASDPLSDRIGQSLISKDQDRRNNILSASASYDMTKRYHAYIVKSQMNPTSLNISGGKASSESIVQQNGGSIDNVTRRTRDLIISQDDSNSSQTAKERAIWEANIRRARSFNYTCEVQGYAINEDSDVIWEQNKLVYVEDDKCDVASDLLIKDVRYTFSVPDGRKTSMTLGFKDSYTLQAEQDEIDARADQVGTGVF